MGKLTTHPDICFAFNNDDTEVKKKAITDCFNQLREKIKRVLSIKKGSKPLIERIKIKGLPSKWTGGQSRLLKPGRIPVAFEYSKRFEEAIEAEKDPTNKKLLSFYFNERKPGGKHLTQAELGKGVGLSRQKVNKRMGQMFEKYDL